MSVSFIDFYIAKRANFALEGPVLPLNIEKLSICPTLNSFKTPEIQKNFLKTVAGTNNGKVYLALQKNTIVGYAVMNKFVHGSKFSLPKVLELNALEISKYHRRCSLASELMSFVKNDKSIEDYIVLIEAKNMFRYHQSNSNNVDFQTSKEILLKIFARGNFSPMFYEDEKSTEKSETTILVKIGSKAPRDVVEYLFSDLKITKPSMFRYSINSRLR